MEARMSVKRTNAKIERIVALCYVRQYGATNENAEDSPERQRALIEQHVKAQGWTPEWYEDVSSRSVTTRPGWLMLEKRLADPDVVALVAYDPARIHLKGRQHGRLLEQIEMLHLHLVLVTSGFHIDATTEAGRMMARFMALFDECYAEYRKKPSKKDKASPGAQRNTDDVSTDTNILASRVGFDTTTEAGRITAVLMDLFDEFYAEDYLKKPSKKGKASPGVQRRTIDVCAEPTSLTASPTRPNKQA
jgi:DNA invertase Pin-like site-specific DNA recombinase